MAEGPGAKPVARVDRRTIVQQFGRQSDAISVNSRKQRQRHFDRTDLRLDRLKTKADFAARRGFRSQRRGCSAQRRDDVTERSELKIQTVSPGSFFLSG